MEGFDPLMNQVESEHSRSQGKKKSEQTPRIEMPGVLHLAVDSLY